MDYDSSPSTAIAGFFFDKKKSHENFIWRMSSTHIITVPVTPNNKV